MIDSTPDPAAWQPAGAVGRAAAGRQAEGLKMNRPSPRARDKRDPTKWFVAIIIGLAVVAVLVAMEQYL